MGLSEHIARLASLDAKERDAAAEEIYIAGSILARRAARAWLKDAEFVSFVGAEPKVTVGLAVPRELFSKIREANGSPRLAEFLCSNVDGATQLLRERFGVTPIYPETRGGANGTRVNFFLVATDNDKVLIELYEKKNA